MRYLCPTQLATFHDWSDDQPEPAEPQVPPLRFCPQHAAEEPQHARIERAAATTDRLLAALQATRLEIRAPEPNKEEKQNP